MVTNNATVCNFFTVEREIPLTSHRRVRRVDILSSFGGTVGGGPVFVLVLTGFFGKFGSIKTSARDFF